MKKSISINKVAYQRLNVKVGMITCWWLFFILGVINILGSALFSIKFWGITLPPLLLVLLLALIFTVWFGKSSFPPGKKT